MASSDADLRYSVVCPHCNRGFESRLLGGSSSGQRGFKCPHCRLFVAYASVEAQLRPGPQG